MGLLYKISLPVIDKQNSALDECTATELKFGETSFAQIEKGRDGEWNKKRNLAPGFIREEETRVSCCYLRCLIGERGGGGLRFKSNPHKGEWGERPKRMARRAF